MEGDFVSDYIYLDYEERRRFAAASHDYLIRELRDINIKEMTMWIFVCKHSLLWCHLPNELINLILKEIQGFPLLL